MSMRSARLRLRLEIGEHGIAGSVENPPAAFGDEVVSHEAIGGKPPQRSLRPRQPAGSSRNIGRKNRRDLAFMKTSREKKPAAAECRQKFPGATMAYAYRASADQAASKNSTPSGFDGR